MCRASAIRSAIAVDLHDEPVIPGIGHAAGTEAFIENFTPYDMLGIGLHKTTTCQYDGQQEFIKAFRVMCNHIFEKIRPILKRYGRFVIRVYF